MSFYYKRLFLLYFFIAVNLICYCNSLPLKHEEPRRAIIAQEMLFTKNFIVPKICQEPYYKKPPFHNWIIALFSIKDKYISNFDARFPSLLSLILMSLFTFILYKDIDKEIAYISAIISLTSFSTMISYGMKAEPDMLFTFLFFGAYFFFIKDKIFISSLFMGASILTKGISPIFFYPGLIIYSFFEKDKKELIKKLGKHFTYSLLLPVIWLILYYYYGNITNLFHSFFSQVKDRTVSNFYKIIKDAIEFPFRAFLALLPWSLIFIFNFKKKKFDANNKILLSSLSIFSVIFLILFIFPCGKGRYFLPAVPFFGIIAGNFINFDKKVNSNIYKYLSLTFLIGTTFFIVKGYYFQSFLLFVLGISMFVFFSLIVNIKELGLAFSVFILLISCHFFNFYRSKYMYNYKNDAILIVNKLKKYGKYPIVVDKNYNKLRLLFNLEREYKMPLYKEKFFNSYFYISTKIINNKKLLFKKRVKNKELYFYLNE